MSSDQLIVLVLLAAAFAAGWFARGGRLDRAPGTPTPPAPPRSNGPDPLVAQADDALSRALTAARAARAVVIGPAGASEAARASVLRILDQRLVELEDCADQLETARGTDDEAFAAFDRAVSGMASVRRRITDEADLDGVEAAREAWERVARQG